MKHAGTLLKYAGLLLWAACFWMLFDASLDIPAQGLRKPALEALQAILLLLILSAAACCSGRGAFGSTGPTSEFSCCSVS